MAPRMDRRIGVLGARGRLYRVGLGTVSAIGVFRNNRTAIPCRRTVCDQLVATFFALV